FSLPVLSRIIFILSGCGRSNSFTGSREELNKQWRRLDSHKHSNSNGCELHNPPKPSHRGDSSLTQGFPEGPDFKLEPCEASVISQKVLFLMHLRAHLKKLPGLLINMLQVLYLIPKKMQQFGRT